MIEFDIGEVGGAVTLLGNCGHTLAVLPNFTFNKDVIEKITTAIDIVCAKAPRLDLNITLQAATDLRRLWSSYGTDSPIIISDYSSLQGLSLEMKHVSDFAFRELSSRKAILMSSSQASMFAGKEPLFGNEVFEAFSFAREDIEEAGKCLALERSTASVFHLMRALESGVQVIANKIGASILDAGGKGLPWGVIAENMKPKIDAMQKGSQAQIKWYRVQNNLVVVNRAWRVPTNHPKETYTLDQAVEVFDATKAFMKELAALV
jgi:hypothetical protein